MTQYGAEVARDVMSRVTAERKRQRLSAAKLAEACTAAGMPMTRDTVATLENGRRASLTVAEVLAFAYALEVPLLELLYGVDALPEPSPLGLPAGEGATAGELLLQAQAADGTRGGWNVLEAVRGLAHVEGRLVESAHDSQALGTAGAFLDDHLKFVARAAAESRWTFLEVGVRPPLLGNRVRAAFVAAGFVPVLELLESGPVEGDPTARRRVFRQALERVAPRPTGGLGRGVGVLYEGGDDGDA